MTVKVEFKKDKYDLALDKIRSTLNMIDTFQSSINSKKTEVDTVSEYNHIYLYPIDDEIRKVELLLNAWKEHLTVAENSLKNVYNIWQEYSSLSADEQNSKSDYYTNVFKTITHFSFESPEKFMDSYEAFKRDGSGDFYDYVVTTAGVTSKIIYLDEYIDTIKFHIDTVADAYGNPVVSDDYVVSDWADYLVENKEDILNGYSNDDASEEVNDEQNNDASSEEVNDEQNNNTYDESNNYTTTNNAGDQFEDDVIKSSTDFLPRYNDSLSGLQTKTAILVGNNSNNSIGNVNSNYVARRSNNDETIDLNGSSNDE
ncbi:MAG: hypothetical protein IKF37_01350 [Bacilli bacterium]|nr:hypothetical protein [Bacilli bacterium]